MTNGRYVEKKKKFNTFVVFIRQLLTIIVCVSLRKTRHQYKHTVIFNCGTNSHNYICAAIKPTEIGLIHIKRKKT